MTLWVFGCSASDRTEVETCYGDFLSKFLNLDYQHHARGCGSNDRIFRTLPHLIKNNDITADDLVIIQYTEETRTEFYSNIVTDLPLRDAYDNGQILRYKANSHTWQPNQPERKFFRMYEKYFLDDSFCNEKFAANNFMLQCTMYANKINAWFLNIHGYTPPSFETIPAFESKCIPVSKQECEEMFFDGGHFHVHGHKKIAKKIQNMVDI